jgi:NAD(P)-dependent dehydrogenase (short-subunit alcohol dehydrogenase family)
MPDKHTAAHLKSSLERTLLKRLGGPQEIARTVRFLAESDFITGITLPVDGGRMLAN